MITALFFAALLGAQDPQAPAPDWEAQGREALAERLAVEPKTGPARNVILFIGDGMDITTISAARILGGQKQGLSGEENVLGFETLPHTALSKTYNTDMQTPDSAGTATAMLSGRKTRSGMLNVDQGVPRGDCEAARGAPLDTLADVAAASERSVGIVTTARLTHATPASVYASAPERDWESDADMPADSACADIARQLLDRAEAINLKVAFGGGRSNFLPQDMADPEYEDRTGRRMDGRNLVEAWNAMSRDNRFVWNEEGFEDLDPAAGGAVLGLFEPSHLRYEPDRQTEGADEPSLAEMTRFAIEKLDQDEDGYFLMVESGRVDHAHHAGNAARALEETLSLDEAVKAALETVDLDETLILVTADHGHTLSFAGYPQRGNPILGIVKSADSDGEAVVRTGTDGRPYTTLGYANGPGALAVGAMGAADAPLLRPDLGDEQAQHLDYRQQSLVPSPSETHGGQDVAVYAAGPGAYLVGGVLEQNVLYYVMEHALTGAGTP
ncbi:alkaline phosphatase [Parvularcula oceani]|uniref:alkaline phosphatase n=1 Tax=Parvularcula oceani TaxID=1247963 RepID=UPI000564FEC8|nr:alkaline phosphatase [Parvularcula oceani]